MVLDDQPFMMASTRATRSTLSKPSYGSVSKSYIASKIKSRSKSVEDITAPTPSYKSSFTSRYGNIGNNDKNGDDIVKPYTTTTTTDCSNEKTTNPDKTRFQFFGHITKTPSPVLGTKATHSDMHVPKKSTRTPSSSVTCKDISQSRHATSQSHDGSKTLPGIGVARRYTSYTAGSNTAGGGGRLAKDNAHVHTSYPRSSRVTSNAEGFRRSRSCEALQEGRAQVHDKNFPVCHRFPNCSVCTIDIKHQEKVRSCDHLKAIREPMVKEMF